MSKCTRVLVAGRSQSAIERYAAALRQSSACEVEVRLIVNGHADPLHGVSEMPDVLVLCVEGNSSAELEEFGRRPPESRPPAIVIAGQPDPESMRLAMRAGARDFFAEPVDEHEFLGAIDTLAGETRSAQPMNSNMLAVINAKGGSGASFLAANLAYVLQKSGGFETALVDLDLRFAPLGQYLDMYAKQGIEDAIAQAQELDEVALSAYLTRTEPGLSLLAPIRGRDVSPFEHVDADASENWARILTLMDATFDQIVVDVPRHIDALGAVTIERADRVMVVLQQSLPSIREAAYVRDMLRRSLGVEKDRIQCVVNRYSKHASVGIDDIEHALKIDEVLIVPNHFKSVAESVDMGVPILDHAPSSPVSRALVEIASSFGTIRPEPASFISKTISSILRT